MGIDAHIELITGTMFSGKSTELIRRLNRYEHHGLQVQTFKPIIDTRYSTDHVISHDGLQRKVIRVTGMKHLLDELRPETTVVGIDEVQFFEDYVINWAHTYAQRGGIVVASGLLKDFRDEYFPLKPMNGKITNQKTMSDFLAIADIISPLKSLCKHQEQNNGQNICGGDATRVQRFIDGKVAPYDSSTIQIGGTESYVPLCRKHFQFYK